MVVDAAFQAAAASFVVVRHWGRRLECVCASKEVECVRAGEEVEWCDDMRALALKWRGVVAGTHIQSAAQKPWHRHMGEAHGRRSLRRLGTGVSINVVIKLLTIVIKLC
jgi:hypothetical protein